MYFEDGGPTIHDRGGFEECPNDHGPLDACSLCDPTIDDPFAADATSPSPEWPAIDDLEDLEGAAFAAQQQRLNSEAA